MSNRKPLKIKLKKNARKKCRYSEKTKEKDKKEEWKFMKKEQKEAVSVKRRITESKIKSKQRTRRYIQVRSKYDINWYLILYIDI